MKKIPKALYKFYIKFYNSIAFYPLIITSLLFLLAMTMTVYENMYRVKWVEEYSFLWVKSHENARGILTTIIGGIISLMVFSFSMVMIVLNQASSNFSPRVIPGLITQRPHQIVLGFYLGTIIYGLILLHNIKPEASSFDLPQLGIFLGELLGIICISLFVFFIHSISKSIQIDNVITKIFSDTRKKLNKDDEKYKTDENKPAPDMTGWTDFFSVESGYYRDFKKKIIEYASKNDLVIFVDVPKGTFIVKNYLFLKINKNINEKEFNDAVSENFIFHQDEFIEESPVYGFKQLSEIAIKALSPGINDTGSAIRVIENLVMLFEKQMDEKSDELFYDKENNLRLIQKVWTLDNMLYNFIGPIREYGRESVFVTIKLLEAMKFLLYADKKNKYTDVIIHHIKTIAEDADKNIINSADRKKLNKHINNFNEIIDKPEISLLK